jgi:sterol desaturase/sphingolipid hydroxylase (fatty acid hydroxylase superfamily)
MAGPILLGPHAVVMWCYIILRVWETVESHSGYEFPWSVWSLFEWQGGADFHDYHHSHNSGNFGGASSKFWDVLMGTDISYEAHRRRISSATDAKTAALDDIPTDIHGDGDCQSADMALLNSSSNSNGATADDNKKRM